MLILLSCGRDNTAPSKPVGSEGGACTAGGGCDPGLVCLSQLCASLRDAGTTPPNTCSSSPLGGIGVPAGTTASASASYSTNTPDKAIDGILGRGWNSGSGSGWLRLDFPAPTALTGIRIAALASPTTDEKFVITDSVQGTKLGEATLRVAAGSTPAQLAPIPVTPGTTPFKVFGPPLSWRGCAR